MILLSARANQGLRKAILQQVADNLNAGRTVHLYSESLTLDEMFNSVEPKVKNKDNLRGFNIHVNFCEPEVVDSLIKNQSDYNVYHIIDDVKPFINILKSNTAEAVTSTPLVFGLQLPDSDNSKGVTTYGGELAYATAVVDSVPHVKISTNFRTRD